MHEGCQHDCHVEQLVRVEQVVKASGLQALWKSKCIDDCATLQDSAKSFTCASLVIFAPLQSMTTHCI